MFKKSHVIRSSKNIVSGTAQSSKGLRDTRKENTNALTI